MRGYACDKRALPEYASGSRQALEVQGYFLKMANTFLQKKAPPKRGLLLLCNNTRREPVCAIPDLHKSCQDERASVY